MSNATKFGSHDIDKLYFGSTSMDALYIGSKKIWSSGPYDINPTLVNVSAGSSNPTTIAAGGTAELVFYANDGYIMPETVTVSGATSDWAVTNIYSISTTLSDVTAATGNAEEIEEGKTVVLTFTANEGCNLPDGVTIKGATGSWNKNNGELTVSNPTGDVTIKITGSKIMYTITNVLTNVEGNSSNPTTISYGTQAILRYTCSAGYELPDKITVTGVTDYSYVKSDSQVTIYKPTGNVTITINGQLIDYTITPTLTNVTADASNPTTISINETKDLIFTSDSGYALPATVDVTGATGAWSVKTIYDISGTATNCYFDEALTQTSYTNTCLDDGTVTIELYADGTNYAVPTEISVTGGVYTKTSNTRATLVITNPTEDVSFAAEAPTTTAAPSNLSASGTTLTFDPVDGATAYEAYAKDSSGAVTDLGEISA